MISNDGNIIVYKTEPWKGDPTLKITNSSGKEIKSINSGTNAKITNNSQTVVFKIKPKEELVRELKLKKTKKEDMPEDSLVIFNVNSNNLNKYAKLKSYKVPEKWDGWIAFQTKSEIVKDTVETDSLKNNIKVKEESAKNGYLLTLFNTTNNESVQFPFVKDYYFHLYQQ